MIEPFLKWAGGKRWLAASYALPASSTFVRYIEPFLGGGAVFFALSPERSLLSDVNSELIGLYHVVRDDPERLKRILDLHQALHSPDHYYATRAEVPTTAVERAARMLYLNRTCWNGLYRVNTKGQFNVPIGTKNLVTTGSEDFKSIAMLLSKADIRNSDFEATIEEAKSGDFLFVDPPYTVKHNMNGFVKYNENIFSWADQIRLCDSVKSAAKRGAAVMITNADHESVRELYKSDFTYSSLTRSSVLSGLSSGRGSTTEALFLANIP
jgi:DNA adenine methylase